MKGLKRLAFALGLFALPFVAYAAVPNNIAPGNPTILDGTAMNGIYDYLRGNSSGTYVGTFTGSSFLGNSATTTFGYKAGAGGAVTQATSRTTGVTLNTPTGAITMFTAAGSATAATFTVTNSSVAATDTVVLSVKSATNLYETFVTAVAAGSFNVTFFTTGGTASDAPCINYAVIKGAAS